MKIIVDGKQQPFSDLSLTQFIPRGS